MIVNTSDTIKNKFYNFKSCHTPLKNKHKDPTSTRSHKSFANDKRKLDIMLQMNRKYEEEVINSQFFKLKQLPKYSPKKLSKIDPNKSFQNLSPLKIYKANSPIQNHAQRRKNYQSSKTIEVEKNFTLFGQKFTQKKIIQNQTNLPQIPSTQINISKIVEDSWLKNPNDSLLGYWIPQNKIVSLFPVNNRKIDKVPVINQPYILPMLGITIKDTFKKSQKFIITELHQNTTLRDIKNEFENLDQQTVKSYLRKIILCVWNLHKNRIAHNRLSLDAFVCAQNGDVLLNMLKSSSQPLTQKQKFQTTHYFSPQMLLSRTNYDSVKNDIWSIGCMTLELLTNYEIKSNAYHPYNQVLQQDQAYNQTKLSSMSPNKDYLDSFIKEIPMSPTVFDNSTKISTAQVPKKNKAFRFLTSFESSRVSCNFNFMKDSSSILEKVKRLIEIDSPKVSNQSLIFIQLCQSVVMKQISPEAANFVKRCLSIKLQKRPSIDQLMFHPFLK